MFFVNHSATGMEYSDKKPLFSHGVHMDNIQSTFSSFFFLTGGPSLPERPPHCALPPVFQRACTIALTPGNPCALKQTSISPACLAARTTASTLPLKSLRLPVP